MCLLLNRDSCSRPHASVCIWMSLALLLFLEKSGGLGKVPRVPLGLSYHRCMKQYYLLFAHPGTSAHPVPDTRARKSMKNNK